MTDYGAIYAVAAGKRRIEVAELVKSTPTLVTDTDVLVSSLLTRLPVVARNYAAFNAEDKRLFDGAAGRYLAAQTRRDENAAANEGRGQVVESKIGDNTKRYAAGSSSSSIHTIEDDWETEGNGLLDSLSCFTAPTKPNVISLFGMTPTAPDARRARRGY